MELAAVPVAPTSAHFRPRSHFLLHGLEMGRANFNDKIKFHFTFSNYSSRNACEESGAGFGGE